MNRPLLVHEKAQMEANTIRILADAILTLSSTDLNGRSKEIRGRVEARMLAILPGEVAVPASVADIVGLLTDPENQPHQFVGREDLLTKLLVIPIRHVLNQWKEAQRSIMSEEMQQLIGEIEQALEGQPSPIV